MIASIHGEVIKVDFDGIVISINGLGIKVLVTEETRLKHNPGDRIFLHTIFNRPRRVACSLWI